VPLHSLPVYPAIYAANGRNRNNKGIETMKKANAYVIYDGPSQIDGQRIVAIANVAKSRNTKTGSMLQTYILRPDINPLEANKTGEDFSICGNCPHRGEATNDPARKTAKNRSCYVNLGQGVLITYKAYKAGKYPAITGHDAIASLGAGRMVRIGTYGDGAAVPSYIWESLISQAAGHTAYSHQSGENGAAYGDFDPNIYMQSADTESEALAAWRAGRRTFRVIDKIDAMIAGKEILCPASEEAGRKTQCIDCGLCGGNSTKSPKSIAIVAHGAGAGNFKRKAA